MVFKKRRLGMRRFRRRRTFRRTGRFRKAIKRVVRRMSEVKYVTQTAVFGITANVGIIANITPSFPVSSGKQGRIGGKIKYKMMSFRLDAEIAADVNLVSRQSHVLRLSVFQTRTTLSAVPVLTDFFDTNNNFLSTVKGDAVRVMYDKFFTVTPQTGGLSTQFGSDTGRIILKKHFRIGNNVTFRDDTITAPTQPEDNYYLVITSSLLNAGANLGIVQGSYFNRISFTDI